MYIEIMWLHIPQGTYTPQAGTEKSAGFFTVYRC